MRWKSYSETRGNPPEFEVVLRFDRRDEGHPYLKSRIASYQAEGRAVVLKPLSAPSQSRRQAC